MTSLKEWALYYASLGFAVFPLKPKSKKPATINGFYDASKQEKDIEKWWNINPNFNIGIATGKVSGGLVVIDIDKDEEKGVDGYEALREWEIKNGKLPETWRSVTGRGGYHIFYKSTISDYDCKQGLYPGIDVRANGGYITAPPSIHPDTNRIYEWEQNEEDGISIADVTTIVENFLGKSSEEEKISFRTPDYIGAHERNTTLYKLACSMRARGDAEEAIKAALEATNRTRCYEPLSQNELEVIFNSAMKQESGTAPYKVKYEDGAFKPQKVFKPIEAISAAQLNELDIPPTEWLVHNILPVGLSMIGAPSKYFKSFMALGLCVNICNGSQFLGFDTNKCACLYLDLESTKRRPRSRLQQILGLNEPPKNLYIITGDDEPGRINDGFERQIEYQLEKHPEIKLIIVDVFQMIRQPAKRNQSGYDRDYEDFKVLKQIADKHSIGVMLIHHTRKMKDPNDVFNELSGSVGVMGALDCAWVITKEDRMADEGTLHITGRDMESQKLKIKFNKKTFCWEYLGTAEEIEAQQFQVEYDNSPVIQTIKKLVNQGSGHWEGSASDIQEASKYLGSQIYDDVRKIGTIINKFEALLYFDGIRFEFRRTNRDRKYIFNDTNVIHNTNITNDTNVI